MNKLEGFFRLNEINIPTVRWERYCPESEFLGDRLWTVRTAVIRGNDFNLPRLVGAGGREAKEFAEKTYSKLGENGLVIFYPFFLAEKSGTLEVTATGGYIEAVEGDLWNLVTHNKREVSIELGGEIRKQGNVGFLSEYEINELSAAAAKVRAAVREELASGKSALLEWSYASNCDGQRRPVGERFLLFYEIRTV